MSDADLRFRPAPDGTALVDATTGLAWELAPEATPLRWHEALASTQASGWRLPTVSELVVLLTSLPSDHPFPGEPRPGDLFWSASESPFAPATRVRAVEIGADLRAAVLLLDKDALARRWRARDRS